jgi:diacylglycerol kinase family enzyme
VGFARDDTGRLEYWNNTLGIGFDAAVGFTTKRYAFARGFTMYLLATLDTIARNFAPTAMQIDIDGEVRAESALMLTVGNGPREGGGFNTTPASRIDDGVLEYCLARPMSRPRMLALLPEFQRGTHGRFVREVALGSLTRLRARWERALPIHMDGEMFADFGSPVRELEIGVVPGALKVLA